MQEQARENLPRIVDECGASVRRIIVKINIHQHVCEINSRFPLTKNRKPNSHLRDKLSLHNNIDRYISLKIGVRANVLIRLNIMIILAVRRDFRGGDCYKNMIIFIVVIKSACVAIAKWPVAVDPEIKWSICLGA